MATKKKPDDHRTRPERIMLSLTKAERTKLEAAAEKAKRKLAEYIRLSMLGELG